MLADQIDSARRAENASLISEEPAERILDLPDVQFAQPQWIEPGVSRPASFSSASMALPSGPSSEERMPADPLLPRSNIIKPNTNMTAPQIVLMLIPSERLYSSGLTTRPEITSNAPSSANMSPMGSRMSSRIWPSSPEQKVQHKRHDQHNYSERRRPAVPHLAVLLRPLRQGIDQAGKLVLSARLCHDAHNYRDHKAGGPRKDCCPEVLSHLARIDVQSTEPSTFDSNDGVRRQGEPMMKRCCRSARQQSQECAVSGRSLPKHSQQERRKQRSVHKCEDKLQHVHDVVESRSDVRRCNRNCNAKHGGHPTHPQVVLIACTSLDVRLIDVVGPHRVERRHVPGHPRHETRHQRCQSYSKHSGRKVVTEHHRDRQIIVKGPIQFLRKHKAARSCLISQCYRDHPRKNHQEREEHLWYSSDQRSATRRRHRVGGHRSLHYQKVGAPVTKRQHESESHRQTEPFNPHRI